MENQSEIESLRAENIDLKEEIQLLREQVDFLMKKLFDKKSEKSDLEGMISLFDDDGDFFKRQSQLKNKSKAFATNARKSGQATKKS